MRQERDTRNATARATCQAGLEKLPLGRARLLPTLLRKRLEDLIRAEITYTANTAFQGGERRYDNTDYSVNLSQPLYRKQNFALYQQGKA